MATLINGNLNNPVYASQDADLLASICGNKTVITPVGSQFAHELEDANTIKVDDGVIITKEGRRIQLDNGDIDEFLIPTGTQGQTNYYICGYHLYTDEESAELCETFVEPVSSGTDTIDEDTFRDGSTEVYVSLLRVKQEGVNITAITRLLSSGTDMNQINVGLSDEIINRIAAVAAKVSKSGDTMNGNLNIQGLNKSIQWRDMNENTLRRNVWAGFANSGGDFYLYDSTRNKEIAVSRANGINTFGGVGLRINNGVAQFSPNNGSTWINFNNIPSNYITQEQLNNTIWFEQNQGNVNRRVVLNATYYNEWGTIQVWVNNYTHQAIINFDTVRVKNIPRATRATIATNLPKNKFGHLALAPLINSANVQIRAEIGNTGVLNLFAENSFNDGYISGQVVYYTSETIS